MSGYYYMVSFTFVVGMVLLNIIGFYINDFTYVEL